MKRNSITPPPELVQYVGGDFQKVGKEFMNHFIQIGALQSNEKVLDVGCGVGRMAVPLMNYLTDDGAYYGFDLFKMGLIGVKIILQLDGITSILNMLIYTINSTILKEKKMPLNIVFHMKTIHSILSF